jgi:hypothetical protein
MSEGERGVSAPPNALANGEGKLGSMECICVYSLLNLRTDEVIRFSADHSRRLTALWTDDVALVERTLGALDASWRPCQHTADPAIRLLLLRFRPVDPPASALAA